MGGMTNSAVGSGGKGAPGTVDPFSQGLLQQNTGMAMTAMDNRYRQQLGLGIPGGHASQAAASGTSLPNVGMGTPEQMDLGMIPSLVGGIPAMSEATLGQMQTNALSSAAGGGGGKGGGGLGGLGSLATLGGF
jgi:hypothetical protein